MDNSQFLTVIKNSFIKFLETGSRSNEKLKILHGAIAADLSEKLGSDFSVKSLGFSDGKEAQIQGRYIDKNVDITILDKQNKPIAGIGVKFVMQNYAQNSNNYFENMLGETANIQSNNIPYFQIFIIPDCVPYYDNQKNIKRWERFSLHQAKKYIKLSEDNPDYLKHAPTRTLFYLVHITNEIVAKNEEAYRSHYQTQDFDIVASNELAENIFSNGIILNDYQKFIEKITHRILSI